MIHALLCAIGSVLPIAQDVEGPPTCRLEGLVVDARDQPVPGCEVWTELCGQRLARSNSDATGWFTLPLQPRSGLVLHARQAGRAAGAFSLDALNVPRDFAVVRLLPVRTVRGVVRRSGGEPVANAWVAAVPVADQRLALVTAQGRTDAGGAFELREVLAGPVTLWAFAPGHEIASLRVATPGDATAELELDPEPRREFELRLQNATPEQLASARLLCRGEAHDVDVPLPPQFAELRPDRDGRCKLLGVPDDLVLCIDADVPGQCVEPMQERIPIGPRHWECSFAIAGNGSIRGHVVTPDGRRPAGRTVACTRLPLRGASTTWGRTDERGDFALPSPVRPGAEFWLWVVDGDWEAAADGEHPERMGAYVARHGDQPHVVPLVALEQFRLKVVDANGQPMPGLAVSLHASSEDDENPFVHAVTDLHGAVGLPVATDRHGIEPTVRVQHNGQLFQGELAALDVAADGTRTISVPAPASLTGRVVDAAGAPCFGARVSATVVGFGRPAVVTTVADRDGRYWFPSLYGVACHLHVALGEASALRPSLKLASGEEATAEITLPRHD